MCFFVYTHVHARIPCAHTPVSTYFLWCCTNFCPSYNECPRYDTKPSEAQSAGEVEYTNCISTVLRHPNECPDYDVEQSEAQSAKAVEYVDWISAEGYDPTITSVLFTTLNHFIVIVHRSTLTRSGSTGLSPIPGSKRTVWPFKCVQTNDWCIIDLIVIHSNTWNHSTVYKWILNK